MANGNRPVPAAHCPLCGAALMNASPGKSSLRLYCEVCKRFIHIGPKKPYGDQELDIHKLYEYLTGHKTRYLVEREKASLEKATETAKETGVDMAALMGDPEHEVPLAPCYGKGREDCLFCDSCRVFPACAMIRRKTSLMGSGCEVQQREAIENMERKLKQISGGQ